MIPPNGLKVVLTNKSVLVKCKPLCSTKRKQDSWGLWIGTIAVKGQSGYRVGQRIIYHEKTVVRIFLHDYPKPEERPKWLKRRIK